MSEKEKQLITILRLFNLSQGIMGLILSFVMILYVFMFGMLGLAASSSTDKGAEAGIIVGLSLTFVFGIIAIVATVSTVLHFYLAWKLETPKKWIWMVQIVLICLQFLNLYYLPINIYFLIQLLKPEYKDYYVE